MRLLLTNVANHSVANKVGVSNCLLSRALLGQNRIEMQCKRKFFQLYLPKTENNKENIESLNQHESTLPYARVRSHDQGFPLRVTHP